MRVLITGASGFVGRHLTNELSAAGHDVQTMTRSDCDITDASGVLACIREARPEAVVHLAAIASVSLAERNQGVIERVNVGGTVNCLEAFKRVTPGGRFLFVSSAQVYGCTGDEESEIVRETSTIDPCTPYARSKAEAERHVLQAQDALNVLIVRPANHIGPGQSVRAFVPSVLAQARAILRGERAQFVAGNMASGRDFTDVRDIVSAYRLIIEKGTNGTIYNVSAGQMIVMHELFEKIRELTGTEAPIVQDPALVRTTDFSRRLETSRIRSLGWRPKWTLETTLKDMVKND